MKTVEEVMKGVLSQPTAPYRENWVLSHIENELKKLSVPFFRDSWGNIVAGTSSPASLKKSKRVVLVAHTDHPGFHLLKEIEKNVWQAQWFGGVPPKTYLSQVAIHHPKNPGFVAKGQIISRKFFGPKKNLFLIKIKKNPFLLNSNCFGAFDYNGFVKRGSRIITRAADDLAGVTIILSTLARLKKTERKNILGLFTRAEETGFRGALGFIYKKILGPENTVISLEASRQLEGARIGSGPVIRLGDKRSLFDSTVTARLDEAAAYLSKRKKAFKVQRRIMNGGTCEATAFGLHGFRSSGIAVPLGHYHNQRPNGRPGPEFVDLRDVENAVRLCVEFYKQTHKGVDPISELVKKMSSGFKTDSKYLHQEVEFSYV
jgi:putative aminopeptidase FrvX